ncbi:MAG TPA: protein translocase subunit SecD [Candidatus Megaira endosymbiont of Nemacystus decipiens]|nr:protein translocase subunit SecD [Candidatus Megaera endosymbiont of Nemacystus decipiens]
MYKISKLKLITAILITISAIFIILPNISTKEEGSGNSINLGLDLKGGAHLLLNVDFDSYMQDVTQSVADSIKKALRNDKISYKDFKIKPNNISFTLRNEANEKKVFSLVKNIDTNISSFSDGKDITIYYDEYAINQMQDRVINQSIEIVRMRVDSNGTKEPNIQRQGALNILLQVPGESNPAELKRILGKTARLTFHRVVDNMIENIPSNKLRIVNSEDGTSLAIIRKFVISGDQLIDARVQFQNGMPVVHFSLNHIGARKFGDFTKASRGQRLAIVLDGKVLSSPSINDPITTGEGFISGNFSIDSANELALMLRAGALPAPLKIIEERTVGPNLGADSIQSGRVAAIVGFAMVVIFMILSYGVLGVFASVTLIVALLYIFALLTLLQATLTLPGIAGIILTIGMAVDANVLIYERIREELSKGSSNLYAVKTSFDSVFTTIMDSNVTTLIAAFLLYNFGVGAIKGFAVTLTIGIITSMYTALVINRLMIDIWLTYKNPKTIIN